MTPELVVQKHQYKIVTQRDTIMAIANAKKWSNGV
jgi:hypothetical protein